MTRLLILIQSGHEGIGSKNIGNLIASPSYSTPRRYDLYTNLISVLADDTSRSYISKGGIKPHLSNVQTYKNLLERKRDLRRHF